MRNESARLQWLLKHPIWTYKERVTVPIVKNGRDTKERQEVEQVSGHFEECFFIETRLVNPETLIVDEDTEKNTEFYIRIDAGPWEYEGYEWGRGLDPNLTCEGKDLRETLLKLADLVELHYNQDGTKKILSAETPQCECYDVGDQTCCPACGPRW